MHKTFVHPYIVEQAYYCSSLLIDEYSNSYQQQQQQQQHITNKLSDISLGKAYYPFFYRQIIALEKHAHSTACGKNNNPKTPKFQTSGYKSLSTRRVVRILSECGEWARRECGFKRHKQPVHTLWGGRA